jgi:flavin reductase (DIM6/NTAB) family NADH-FMN oxidoreductase RutF
MRQLVGAVTLITTEHEGQRRGLTATAVASLSAQPPSLLVCINRTAEAHPYITAGRRFCVNLLAYEQQSLAESFAARDGTKGEARFARGEWGKLVTGAPYLTDCLVAFDCELAQELTVETHTIFVGHVVGLHTRRGEPLLYEDGHFKRLHPSTGPVAHNTELFRGEHTESILF